MTYWHDPLDHADAGRAKQDHRGAALALLEPGVGPQEMLRASGQPPGVRAGDDLWNDQVVVFARVLDVVACVEISRPGGVP